MPNPPALLNPDLRGDALFERLHVADDADHLAAGCAKVVWWAVCTPASSVPQRSTSPCIALRFSAVSHRAIRLLRIVRLLRMGHHQAALPHQRAQVEVRITGRILGEQYTHALMQQPDLSLMDVFLLDKVQKRLPISADDAQALRARWRLVPQK